MTAVKVIKVLGTSDRSWEDAARNAVAEASKTLDDIHGVEVDEWTADIENGEITQYKTTVQIAFPVEKNRRRSNQRKGTSMVRWLLG